MPAAPKPCLFCEIAQRNIEAAIVYEDEVCTAFLDHRPVFHGPCLLLPRAHRETYFQLSADELGAFGSASQTLGRAGQKARGVDGIFLAVNNKVSQSVPHLHMHIVPRRFKDGLKGFFWPRQKYSAEVPIEDVQRRIVAAGGFS